MDPGQSSYKRLLLPIYIRNIMELNRMWLTVVRNKTNIKRQKTLMSKYCMLESIFVSSSEQTEIAILLECLRK